MTLVRFTVEPVPLWLDAARLLAPARLEDATRTPLGSGHERLELLLSATLAAELSTRLRGLGLDGRALLVHTEPPLARARVREARLLDARSRRETTPGFTRPGARATGEGRYSLTPEALALALGALARGEGQPAVHVLDACCGSGGNTIGFARAGCTVTALELSAERLAEAQHNAAIYGVAERIAFERADACQRVPELSADLLFIDPPWGEQYDKRATSKADFPLLLQLLAGDLGRFGQVWLKLPGSFEVASVKARPRAHEPTSQALAGVHASAWFGLGAGDAQRVKFVLLRL